MRLGCERREPEKKEGRELKRVKPKKTGRREKSEEDKIIILRNRVFALMSFKYGSTGSY